MTQNEWGPWIEHDGKGCPCVGMWVQVQLKNGIVYEVKNMAAGPQRGSINLWIWKTIPNFARRYRVIRYRIRKPRGMAILEGLLTDLPKTVDAPEPVDA